MHQVVLDTARILERVPELLATTQELPCQGAPTFRMRVDAVRRVSFAEKHEIPFRRRAVKLETLQRRL